MVCLPFTNIFTRITLTAQRNESSKERDCLHRRIDRLNFCSVRLGHQWVEKRWFSTLILALALTPTQKPIYAMMFTTELPLEMGQCCQWRYKSQFAKDSFFYTLLRSVTHCKSANNDFASTPPPPHVMMRRIERNNGSCDQANPSLF